MMATLDVVERAAAAGKPMIVTHVDPDNPKQFTFSGEPLAHFCRNMQSRLKDRTIRVVGDSRLPVKRVLVSWGFVGRMPGISLFARPDVDVFICGETREWELVEYVLDSITAGTRRRSSCWAMSSRSKAA